MLWWMEEWFGTEDDGLGCVEFLSPSYGSSLIHLSNKPRTPTRYLHRLCSEEFLTRLLLDTMVRRQSSVCLGCFTCIPMIDDNDNDDIIMFAPYGAILALRGGQNFGNWKLHWGNLRASLPLRFCILTQFWLLYYKLVLTWAHAHLWELRTDCESISLIQDACNGWLSVRFGACTDQLQSRFGMIGVSKLADLKQVHALKIKQCTEQILKDFCAPSAPMPCSKKKRKLWGTYILGCSILSMLPCLSSWFRCFRGSPHLAQDSLQQVLPFVHRQGRISDCRRCSGRTVGARD